MIGTSLMIGALFLVLVDAGIWAFVLFWLALVFIVLDLFRGSRDR